MKRCCPTEIVPHPKQQSEQKFNMSEVISSAPVPTPASVSWLPTVLEEPTEDMVNDYIASLFEDIPVSGPRDYAEVDDYDEYEAEDDDCDCDECLGISYYDDRDDYYDGGGLDWNESGYFD